ncbi:MAG: DUF1453 family protein [Methanothrix sp.]
MLGEEYLFIIIFLAVIILLRFRRQSRGSKATPSRIFRYPAIYIFLSIILVAYTPSLILLIFAVLAIILGYVIGNMLGRKSSVFMSEGKMLYKRSNEVFTIWLIAFVVRALIEFVLPIPSINTIPINRAINAFSGVYMWYSVVDILLAFSAGMLLGEALHLYKKYNVMKQSSKQIK